MNKVGPGTNVEWADWTINPAKGCLHHCKWEIDGHVAECYAKTIAEGVARPAYPRGFDHYYWNPDTLLEPVRVKKPSRIFYGSMTDLFGNWVPAEHIQASLDMMQQAYWHTFLVLTKNAPRLAFFKYPPNVQVGVSAPPTWFRGKRLSLRQQEAMFSVQSRVMSGIQASVRWMSIEPLSFDVAPLLEEACPYNWLVVGAATYGKQTYQPEETWTRNLLSFADNRKIPVLLKDNLTWPERRAEYPPVSTPLMPSQTSLPGL